MLPGWWIGAAIACLEQSTAQCPTQHIALLHAIPPTCSYAGSSPIGNYTVNLTQGQCECDPSKGAVCRA